MPFLSSFPLRRFSRLQRLGAVILVVAIGAGLFAFGRGEALTVALAERGELRQAVVASGRVRTPQRVEIAAQITGRVAAVDVREGQTIVSGQTLLRLDDSEWKAGVAQARATLAQNEARLQQVGELGRPVAEQGLRQAEANAIQAGKQYERVVELVAKGFYSTAQLDDAKRAREVADSQLRSARLQLLSTQPGGSDARVAASNVDQARAALAVAEARLGHATLTSPVAGTVLTRTVEPGDTVQPGKLLLTMAPAGESELTAQIDEKNLALLALGQPALASADAYPGERFTAEVSYIAPSVDAQRGSVEIRLRVPLPPAYLKHEMTVSVDIEAARRADALIVPFDTVREAGGAQPWILVVRDGRAQRQAVRLGVRGAGKVEILDGIAIGEALLPAAANVPEGRRVRAVNR
jgi:HlyD family secretion protein